jgi:glyceraldehyde 3-phosphate dehydrogenase
MRVAINGLGRIGRATLRVLQDTPQLELVAANDLVPIDNLAYLIRYDTVYGRNAANVVADTDRLTIGERSFPVFSKKDPAELPWKDLEVDLVFECSGVFRTKEELEKHRTAGAEMVILSAPPKSAGVPMIVHGATPLEQVIDYPIVSTASCTTNCVAPIMEVLNRRIGVEKSLMTTTHGYTSTQALVDGPNKKIRRGRAAAANLVPTSTGAAGATTKSVEGLTKDFDGVALRIPLVSGSIADVVVVTRRETTVEEINSLFREEAASDRYRGVLGITDDPLVSSDIIGDSRGSVIDAEMTRVVGGNLVKVMGWYDNEWGYTCQMVRHAIARAGARPLANQFVSQASGEW